MKIQKFQMSVAAASNTMQNKLKSHKLSPVSRDQNVITWMMRVSVFGNILFKDAAITTEVV
jgi:hypothetical protein